MLKYRKFLTIISMEQKEEIVVGLRWQSDSRTDCPTDRRSEGHFDVDFEFEGNRSWYFNRCPASRKES
jgi:hypothetical protein